MCIIARELPDIQAMYEDLYENAGELAREMGLKKSALAMRVKRSKERFVKQWNRH